MKSVNHSDRNLFFQTNRENLRQPVTYGNYIPEVYYKTGRFTKEAAVRQYPDQLGKGSDKNLFFRTKKRKTPFLPKRVFKDLEPQSRVLGSLDKTKKELQATAVLKGIEGVQGTLLKFLQTEQTDEKGNIIIDPITNKPTMVTRTLDEVLKASNDAIFKIFRDNNIAVSPNLNVIIGSFNNQNVLNAINRFKDIETTNPNLSGDEREALYKGAVLQERMKDPQRVENDEKLNEAVDKEIVEEKVIENDWQTAGFTQRYYKPSQWADRARTGDWFKLKAYIVTKSTGRLAPQLKNWNGIEIKTGRGRAAQMGLMFSQGHYLDLLTLKFISRIEVPQNQR